MIEQFPKLPYGSCRLYPNCPAKTPAGHVKCGRNDYWNCPMFHKAGLFTPHPQDLHAWDKLLRLAFEHPWHITYCDQLGDTCARASNHPACNENSAFCDHQVEIDIKESLERYLS